MDGHAFAADAVARGAAGAVVDRRLDLPGPAVAVLVPDTWRALYDLAGWVLRPVTRLDASWNQGLVRGPDVHSRVSIHSPPLRMFSWCSSAQISSSVRPGSAERRYIRSMPASQTA